MSSHSLKVLHAILGQKKRQTFLEERFVLQNNTHRKIKIHVE